MNPRPIVFLAALAALTACGGDRGAEVAVTDSLSRELAIAAEDTASPLPDERRTQAGARASTTPARPAAKATTRATKPATRATKAARKATKPTATAAPVRVSRAPANAEPAEAAAAPVARARADSTPSDTSTIDDTVPRPTPSAQPSTSGPTDASVPTAGLHVLPSGTQVRALLQDSITSLRNSVGQRVTALVSGDLRAPDGVTLVPTGSALRLSIARLKPARSRSAVDGELDLHADSLVVGGRAYPIQADVQRVPHELKGRGVTAGEAEKVAAGAAVGAAAGGVITGKTRGAVIGGVVGAAGGAVVAAQTASRDVVVTPRTLIVVTLTAPFAAGVAR